IDIRFIGFIALSLKIEELLEMIKIIQKTKDELFVVFFFSSRRRHTSWPRDRSAGTPGWSRSGPVEAYVNSGTSTPWSMDSPCGWCWEVFRKRHQKHPATS